MTDNNPLTEHESLRTQKFADFGEDALAADDLDELLDTAIRNVAEGLEADHAKILTPRPDGDLLIIAGIGWEDGVVGNTIIPADLNSPPGYALKTGQPVRSNNLAEETRFKAPEFLVDRGIRSAVNVIIMGEGKPFGVLEVDSTDVRDFTERDTAFLQGYSQLLSAAIVRVRQTEKLKEVSEENRVLLRELHHRIGNDFQLMMSLIRHRGRHSQNEVSKAELAWVETRLKSLSRLHDQLRRTNSSTHVNLGEYLSSICTELASVHQFSSRSVELDMKTEAWVIGASDAISIGLILNEFVTNSVEHAFSDEGGTVTVELKANGDEAVLTIADNGRGFDDTAGSGRSGLGLMQALAEAVSTRVTRESDAGVRFSIYLKAADPQDE